MARIRAPELAGRGWVGAPDGTTLASLRGRFVLLDFWTFCCVNCLHVLDELRPLEQRWHDVLAVVGVHSPKFAHEAETGAVEAAVARYGVTHPVLDDADMTTWQAYAAKAWPTLVLVDPEGFVVARYAGEGHAHAIDAVLADLVPTAERAGTLRRDGGLPTPPTPTSEGLAFPSGLLALPDGRLLVADTAHHRLVVLDADAETVVARIGTGARGLLDGAADVATFNEPQGMCLLPTGVAAEVGYDVVVADTVNHALRGLRLGDLTVRTVVGTGRAWSPLDPTALSSPWDVAWWDDRVWVAMAGIHQLWTFDPSIGSAQPAAGTRTEGLRDGRLAEAWFAQPSGLAACGNRLWLADAETSALRWVEDGQVYTAVGTGLFDFGFADGDADSARLQHPLGVATITDRSVLVADTYNGALRRFDPAAGLLTTLADGLTEPAQVVVRDDVALVLESGAHRVVAVRLDARTSAPESSTRTERAPMPIAPGPVDLVVGFEPPPGQHLDVRYGAATRLRVTATPAALLRSGEGTSTELVRRLEVDPSVGDGVLHVTASAASCDVDTGEGAACHLHQQDWGIPVVVRADADRRLDLALGAVEA
jgi:thiol-disulfide isomerase/thioredoxin